MAVSYGSTFIYQKSFQKFKQMSFVFNFVFKKMQWLIEDYY